MNKGKYMNDNDMEAIDKKINEVANDELDAIEKHLTEVQEDALKDKRKALKSEPITESVNEGEVKVPKTIKSTSDLEKYFYGLDLKKAKSSIIFNEDSLMAKK